MLCRVRLRAIRSEILVRNFRTFSRLQNFAFEIARNRAQIHAVWWCAASLRSLEVLNICCERQHAVARAIWTGFRTEIFENFRGRKIFHSKLREIAPKFMPPGGAELRHDL